MIKISGVSTNESLKQWEPLLEEWCLLVERYSRAFDGEEHVFDFSERPNVGILAAAAWRCGFLSLEEFGHGKHVAGEEYSTGRCDLWIGTDDLENGWYIEAKHCYASINRGDIINGVKPRLDAAVEDAVRSAQFDSDVEGAGVCFVSIWDQTANINDRTDHIEDLVTNFQSLQAKLGYDAVAWSFPKEARDYQPEDQQYGRLGVILLAKLR